MSRHTKAGRRAARQWCAAFDILAAADSEVLALLRALLLARDPATKREVAHREVAARTVTDDLTSG